MDSISYTDRREAMLALDVARRNIASDPHLANFALRDLAVTRLLGLDGIAWAGHQGSPSRKDVQYLIGRIADAVECGCAKEGGCHCLDHPEAERCDGTCPFCAERPARLITQ